MIIRTILLGVFALVGGFCAAGGHVRAAELQDAAMATIARRAPVLAEAIRADEGLRAEVGAEKWPQALSQLARFVESKDPECQEALRIISDTVARTRAPVGALAIDGDPAEWSGAVPSPEYARFHLTTDVHKEELWTAGAAAVVRGDRLYLMVGLDATYFKDPEHALRVTVDCVGSPAWDARLLITCNEGRWTGTWTGLSDAHAEAKPLAGLVGAVGKAAELAIDIRDFVPPAKAKPVWAVWVEARRKTARQVQWFSSRFLPVFNEGAQPGVAAGPYVRTFLSLCADATLEDSDRAAAAIAITSATMYECGNAEVQTLLRADNAAFLALAREISQWQSERHTLYRLRDYPLEAQLAWACRTPRNWRFLELSRDPKHASNDRENYLWASTGIDALRGFRATAIKEGLAEVSLAETAKRIDRWVLEKQTYTRDPDVLERQLLNADDPLEEEALRQALAAAEQRQGNAEVVGQFRGKPVSEFHLSHSATMLAQIRKRGRALGNCIQHTFLCQDLMRAIGMAPLAFGAEPTSPDEAGHRWPGYYDPQSRCWRSYQPGRKDAREWYFHAVRVPVYTYAALAPHVSLDRQYKGPRPLPLVFSRRMTGVEIQRLAQEGIGETAVREWMLTPGLR